MNQQKLLWLFIFSTLSIIALGVDPKLYLVTVGTERTDGLIRLEKTAKTYGHELHVLGMGEKWQGGSMKGLGGGQKVRLLREHLIDEALPENTVILFVDAYDVIISASPETILRRFLIEFPDTRILFGAEPYCWPDQSLAPKYPLVTFGERFLNSGLFMGFVPEIMKLLEFGSEIYDYDDDQLFYTKQYLDEEKRTSLKMSLDPLALIFQNLNGAISNVNIEYDQNDNAILYNHDYNTHPIIIHGNGPSKITLNYLENYIAQAFNKQNGCQRCEGFKVKNKPETYPIITVAIFIAKPIPFIEEFLESFKAFEYPKDKIDLFIYVNQKRSLQLMKNFTISDGKLYRSVNFKGLDSGICEYSARNEAFHFALDQKSEYIFALDGDVHLEPKALDHIIQRAKAYDLKILAPMVGIKGKMFTNFWGSVSPSGYYERSSDYLDIVEGDFKGFWNVPFISAAILFSGEKLQYFMEAYNYERKLDADMSFAKFCRDYGHFMYVDNQENYGQLLSTEQFGSLAEDLIHAEVYDYPANKEIWEKRYIHPEYYHYLQKGIEVPQPCPDVYDFPFLSERMSKELIEIMEKFGTWSDGTNFDRRLEGGYENVPTRDIHMNQVGFEPQWLQIIDDYVAPMQEKVFTGYYQRPIKSSMMFVVRYRPDEQASLRLHHDASTYSIDISLNKRDVDYEGGGVRYIRYNCTVPADQVGWSMLFPGRLTHLHEGLPTTKGTRYILVSFINP
uniref:procollagen-lysine 5-dioxygenase n=1 Tax=Panagrolaimus davidi TaxID=227884 RepID=A0A914QQ26_9BILA